MEIHETLRQYLFQNGASDVGFAKLDDGDFGPCQYAVCIAVKLSDAIIDEIQNEPTHTYFHHYRTVNALIDQLLLKAGLFLDQQGYRYIPIGASQSINKDGWNYNGRYSHKKAACLAGMGTIGKNSLFLHHKFGARVRLGTLVTDCPLPVSIVHPVSICGECTLCVNACPCNAISGNEWHPGRSRDEMFSPDRCSKHMKFAYQQIGRGAVCGICMRVCPQYKKRV